VATRPRLTPAIADVRRAIRESWERYGYKPGDTVAVACSGGADSLALAAAAIFEGQRAKMKIAVVIINHNLQSGSRAVADKTAKLVSQLGADLVEVIDVVVSKSKQGMEADARAARYAALDDFAKANRVKVTMLGHTLDDQAETVLLGLARGSGAKSLAGMTELSSDKKYLRPLLKIRRTTTESFCNDSGLAFWRDPQNQDKKFSRVRVRKVLLPAMEKELGPGVVEALGRTAEILQEDAKYLDQKADQVFSKVAKVMATQIVLDAEVLAKQPVALANRVVLKALQMLGAEPTRAAISSVMALVTNWHGQKPLTLPAARVSRQGKQVILKSSKTFKPGAC
jgi:tRNA(Ile)-lysidine synthase